MSNTIQTKLNSYASQLENAAKGSKQELTYPFERYIVRVPVSNVSNENDTNTETKEVDKSPDIVKSFNQFLSNLKNSYASLIRNALASCFHDETVQPPMDPFNNNLNFQILSSMGDSAEYNKKYNASIEEIETDPAVKQMYYAGMNIFIIFSLGASGKFLDYYKTHIDYIVRIIKKANAEYETFERNYVPIVESSTTDPLTHETKVTYKSVYNAFWEQNKTRYSEILGLISDVSEIASLFGEIGSPKYNTSRPGFHARIYVFKDLAFHYAQQMGSVNMFSESEKKKTEDDYKLGSFQGKTKMDIWRSASNYMGEYSASTAASFNSYNNANNQISSLKEKYADEDDSYSMSDIFDITESKEDMELACKMFQIDVPKDDDKKKWSKLRVETNKQTIITTAAYNMTYNCPVLGSGTYWNLSIKLNTYFKDMINRLQQMQKGPATLKLPVILG